MGEEQPKVDRRVLAFEGKAAQFKTTETVKLDKDGAIQERVVYDLKVEDEDGHSAGLRQGTPWNVRPGEWVQLILNRTQKRLDEAQ